MKKTYVLDSTVILSNPESLWNYPESEIILLDSILDDVNKQASFGNELGKNARSFRKLFSELTFSKNESVLTNGSIVKVVTLVSKNESIETILLNYCSEFNRKKSNAILVSRDAYLRVKADACGLLAENSFV